MAICSPSTICRTYRLGYPMRYADSRAAGALRFAGSTPIKMKCSFQAARPIILNGIEDVITRPDLADRAIFLTLPHVQEERRRAENEIWREFASAQPYILGALLDAASRGLRALPEVRLEQLPRMADFALWATACETAFCPTGGFLHAYKVNRSGL